MGKNDRMGSNLHPAWFLRIGAHKFARRFIPVLALVASACSGPMLPPSHQPPPGPATITPTPTVMIQAIEQETATPGGSSPSPGGVIWDGIITSETSRQFMSNGQTVNSCKTDWFTSFTVVANPSGDVKGFGEAELTLPPACTPQPISVNSKKLTLSVAGLKDNSQFRLKFSITGFDPNPSGDFGGFVLLIGSMTCPENLRTNVIPLEDYRTAKVTLKYQGVMTGCGGSANDIVSSTNNLGMFAAGNCSSLPASEKDTDVGKLCGL
jgi:hypothetical protein